jgi:hypothetical protein
MFVRFRNIPSLFFLQRPINYVFLIKTGGEIIGDLDKMLVICTDTHDRHNPHTLWTSTGNLCVNQDSPSAVTPN